MISLRALPANTTNLFHALSKINQDEKLLNDFIMIGGTALSMRMAHRQSEDLDFVTTASKLPKEKIDKLLQELQDDKKEIVDITDVGARDDFINDGLDIEDYQQDWLIGNTKLTFFTYGNNPYESSIISAALFDEFQGIKIASIDTIAKTKCHALLRRTKSRDLFDIYHLIKADHITIENVISEMQRSDSHKTYEEIIYRILEKPIQADDEGLSTMGINLSTTEIREYLSSKVAILEQDISKQLLQQRDTDA